jgi:hypothetical protein
MDDTRKYTDLDPSQVARMVYDTEKQANRVVLVGGGDIKIDVNPDNIVKAVESGLSNVKMSQSTIEIPTIIKELQVIEVPTIVKEIVIERIEVPIVVTEVKMVEVPIVVEKIVNHVVEKPIFIEKVIEKVPKYMNYILGVQTIIIIALSIMSRSN